RGRGRVGRGPALAESPAREVRAGRQLRARGGTRRGRARFDPDGYERAHAAAGGPAPRGPPPPAPPCRTAFRCVDRGAGMRASTRAAGRPGTTWTRLSRVGRLNVVHVGVRRPR